MNKFATLSLLVLMFFGFSTVVNAKPTRDEIMAYVEQSKNRQQAMNLIKKFGPDFSNLDLSNLDLRGHYYVGYTNVFTGADFSHSDLHGTILGSGNFDRANFYMANLEGAEFVTATLIGAHFEKANLKNVLFQECDLSKAMLSQADLSRATITGSRFAGANLSRSVLSGARNRNAQMDFSGADLRGANLKGVNLRLAVFRDADLSNAILRNAILDEADFAGANLTNADLQNASIEFANFRNVRGLDKVTEENLVRLSRRSSYELEQLTLKLTRLFFWPSYLVIVLLTAVTGLKLYRPFHKHRLYIFSCITNLFALVPLIILLLIFITAGFLGVIWILLWPVSYYGIIAGIPITFLMMVYAIIRRKHINDVVKARSYIPYFILTFIHYLLAYVLVTKHFFPSA